MRFSISMLVVFLCSRAVAQIGMPVHGEVAHDEQTSVDRLQVELQDSRHLVIGRAMVSPTGSFDFISVPQGDYQVNLTDEDGNILRSDYISLHGAQFGPLTLQLPKRKGARPISGVVSVQQLEHMPSQRAIKEFRRSEQCFRKGDARGSVEHLERAVAIDPDFAEAHHNLGARFYNAGQLLKAKTEFERAIALKPHYLPSIVNLSITLLRLQDMSGAETAARSALALDEHSTRALYLLALSLMWQHKDANEIVRCLRASSTDYPRAHELLAAILARQGDAAAAQKEMAAFEESGLTQQKNDPAR